MKAAVLEAFKQPLVLREVPDPEPAAHGAVVRVAANGVCRSDWHGWVGDWPHMFDLPHVLGHEFCGTVEAVGAEVTRFAPGDRVVVPFSGGDGSCDWCRAGHSHICDDSQMPGFSYWGAFAPYVAVPYADSNLVALPDEIGYVEAASMGCRYMTSFHGLVDQAAVKAGEWVAVHGCGGVGLAAVQIATALGANVIAVDIIPSKLDFAKELGAVAAVNASNADPAEAILELTSGGAEVAVDALGIAATCRNAMRSLRKRGRQVQIGLTSAAEAGEIALPVDLMVERELRLVGSHGMQATRYPAMLRMVATGKLDPGSLVTGTIALEEAGGVLAAMDDFDTLGVTVIDRF